MLLSLSLFDLSISTGYLSLTYSLLPIEELQFLLDNHKLVLFEITQLYYQLEFDIKACLFSAPIKILTADLAEKFLGSLNPTIELTRPFTPIEHFLKTFLLFQLKNAQPAQPKKAFKIWQPKGYVNRMAKTSFVYQQAVLFYFYHYLSLCNHFMGNK